MNATVLVGRVSGIMFAALRVATNQVNEDGTAIAEAISEDMQRWAERLFKSGVIAIVIVAMAALQSEEMV